MITLCQNCSLVRSIVGKPRLLWEHGTPPGTASRRTQPNHIRANKQQKVLIAHIHTHMQFQCHCTVPVCSEIQILQEAQPCYPSSLFLPSSCMQAPSVHRLPLCTQVLSSHCVTCHSTPNLQPSEALITHAGSIGTTHHARRSMQGHSTWTQQGAIGARTELADEP
jgi:hypothetical protein